MANFQFGPFSGGLNDALDPHLLKPDEAQVVVNAYYSMGTMKPVVAPYPDPVLPVSPFSVTRFMHRLYTGIQAPEFDLVAAPGAAGSLNGTFYYVYTFVTAEGVESNHSRVSEPVTVTAQQVNLSEVLTSSDERIVARRIYRKATGGAGLFFLAGTIPDNTSTTFTDDNAAAVVPYFANWKFLEQDVYAVESDGWLYYAYQDGAEMPRKWNGALDCPLGIEPPAAKPLVATGAGTLTGIYQYVVTFIGINGSESQPSTPTDPITVANQGVQLSAIPTSLDSQVIARRVYRTGGTGQFQVVTEIEDNTTTTFLDSIPDMELGATLISDNYAPPPALSGLAGPHHGRLWGWTGNLVYFSEAGGPDAWSPFDYIDFPSPVKRVIPWSGDLLVLTAGGEWLITGQDADSFQAIELPSKLGCLSHRSVVKSEHGILWITPTGIALYNAGNPTLISQKLIVARFLVMVDSSDPNPVDPVNAATYHRGVYSIAGDLAMGSIFVDMRDYPGTIRFFDYHLGTVAASAILAGYVPSALTIDVSSNTQYGMVAGDPRVLRFEDDFVTPQMVIRTGEFTGGPSGQHMLKHFGKLRLDLELLPNSKPITDMLGNTIGTAQGPNQTTCMVYVDGVPRHSFVVTQATTKWYRLPPGLRGYRLAIFLSGSFELRGIELDYENVRRP